jgi:hypothetical protein
MMPDLWRPRQPDEMPGEPWEPHPDSVRGQALAYMDRMAEVERVLRSTWRGRMLLGAGRIYASIRGRLRERTG